MAGPSRILYRCLALVSVLCVAIAVARVALRVEPGLSGTYLIPASAAPAFTTVDAEQSTAQLERRWPALTPDVFRVEWTGYLGVDADDTYTFTLVADDGARLAIDGTPVVDTGAGRGFFEERRAVPLARGVHAVRLEYRQEGGDLSFAWMWARGRGEAAPIESWRLSTRRSAWAAQQWAHRLDVAFAALLVALLLLAAVTWRERLAAAASVYPRAAYLLLFVTLTVLHTWPMAADPAHLSRNDNADTVLNEWALAWVAHQAVTNPLHLFDANIFHPERYTLAYSESMVVQAAMAAPLLWLGASPVLAYNLVLMAGFALNGWVMASLMRRWTGDGVAGAAAGIFFAFNSNILTRLPHMQALHVEFLPLALFAWDELLRTTRVRDALRMGALFALQALTSVYLLVFTFAAVGAAVLARLPEWTGARARRVVPLLVLAGIVAAAVATPFLLPYLLLNQAQGFERSAEDAASMAATLGSYLASSSRFHYPLWSERFFAHPSALFPGVTAVCVAAFAFRRGLVLRDPRARMCLAVGVAGVLLSFGPKVPGYTLLFTFVPIVRVVRVVSSFGYLGLVGLAMVAGYGMTQVRAVAGQRAWPAVAGAILVLAVVEPLAAPLELVRAGAVSPIYDRLRDEPDAVVIEVPFQTQAAGFQQARYMLNSTRHWKPMLNGYSGYRPQSFYETADRVRSFPSDASLAWLRSRGVTHIYVQLGAYDEGMRQRLASLPALREMAADRGVVLYALK